MIHNKYLILGFRLAVGGVFIWAGLLKIADPLGFAQNIKNYRIFPQELSFILALVLPWVEVICGSLLVLGVFSRTAALVAASLLGLFLVLVLATIARGIDVDCGCFGSLSRKVDMKLFLVDSLLFFCALNVFLSKSRAFLLLREK